MDGGRPPPEAFKVRVTQEFDVYLYFQEGILVESDDEKYDIIVDEAINAAFGEDGLTAVLHEQTETSNGYLAYVETLEPMADVRYRLDTVPAIIATELNNRGFTK